MAEDTEHADMIGQLWNCKHAFEIRCPRSWDRLEATGDPGVKFCDQCEESVTMCDSPEEFVRLGNLGKCVATPDACFPAMVSMSSLGRPSVEHIKKLEREKEECFNWWSKCEELKPDFCPMAMGAISKLHTQWKSFTTPIQIPQHPSQRTTSEEFLQRFGGLLDTGLEIAELNGYIQAMLSNWI